eukprot:2547064-Amphidinium_carterae.1
MVAASGQWGIQILLEALGAIFDGAVLPASWSESHVIFMPKGTSSTLDPSQWRPLSLANVCFKILQGYVLQWLTPLGSHFHPSQFGFLQNRYIVQALGALESGVISAAGFHPYAAVLFCDLKNAFGSLHRGFLRA